MRRIHRIVLLATFVAIMPVLAGCADFDMDKLDVFGLGEKKKLPGDRKPVFPEGVPGVTQGIPPEYIKGSNQPQAQPDAALAAPVEPVAAAPAEQPKPKPKRASTPKPKTTAATPPAPPPAAQQPQQTQQTQTPWPAPAANAPPPSGSAAWPAPPPAGTFQR